MPVDSIACASCGRERTSGNTTEVYNADGTERVQVCGDRNACYTSCENCSYAYVANMVFRIHDDTRYCTHCVRADLIPSVCARCGIDFASTQSQRSYTVGRTEIWCTGCKESDSRETTCCHTLLSINAQYPEIYINDVGYRCSNCNISIADLWQCVCGRAGFNLAIRRCTCGRDKDGNVPRCICGGGTDDKPVHEWNCQPRLVFHGQSETGLFFGIELETEIGGHRHTAARYAMERLQPTEIAQLKHDGSVSTGFEIVTQPTTYEHYRNESDILWETIETLRTDHNARSWDPGTCGLHIHVSRAGFTDDAHTHRFIAFIYRNTEMMMKFSGRKTTYAVFDDVWGMDEYDQPYFTVARKLEKGGEKYTAVNVQHGDTLELRFIRGTMRKEGVLSGIGLAHAMVEYTRELDMTELEPIEEMARIEFDWSWASFDAYVREHEDIYPELVERLPKIKSVVLKEAHTIQINA